MLVCIYNFTFKVVIRFEEMDISCGILPCKQYRPPSQQSRRPEPGDNSSDLSGSPPVQPCAGICAATKLRASGPWSLAYLRPRVLCVFACRPWLSFCSLSKKRLIGNSLEVEVIPRLYTLCRSPQTVAICQ